MPGILYVVATPIGNLEDVTLRALRVLREVALIAAEDTRRTAKLLARHAIPTPTTSLHEHNEAKKAPALLARLAAGEDIAVVSDAGTPGVSDPGLKLVQAAIAAGIQVVPVPGPSAVLTALVGSGLPFNDFTFVGFAPSKARARREWLLGLKTENRPVVAFEAPHRVRAFLADALDILGNRQIIVGRELTKVHEEWLRGSVEQVLARLVEPQGEFTVVLAPAAPAESSLAEPVTAERLYAEFCEMTENVGCSRRAAVSALAGRHSLSAREVYQAIEAHKKLV
ncbi:MAG: 16S rRNA (cytidine(1402)-2'-O)-methyltransferase [Acidobacteriota bacterium]|nr:16S rRNA (cytidine(1402)-2'-O)-methyltransferase [Acidobacteriota bacterium]